MINKEETICPLCGKENNCKHNKDCWCVNFVVPNYIIEMIPEDKKDKACICKSCVEKYTKK